jgi:hypothetical protein
MDYIFDYPISISVPSQHTGAEFQSSLSFQIEMEYGSAFFEFAHGEMCINV